jgi:hypothetical protein
MKGSINPYEELANAIIAQAVQDYRAELRFLKRHPHTPDLDTEEAESDEQRRKLKARIEKHECEQSRIEVFFRSEWFLLLTDLDGDVLMRRVREMEAM